MNQFKAQLVQNGPNWNEWTELDQSELKYYTNMA